MSNLKRTKKIVNSYYFITGGCCQTNSKECIIISGNCHEQLSILKSFCEPLEIKSSLINTQQVDAEKKANCNFVILVFFENHFCAQKKIKFKKKLFLDF